jgi:hypothetical protein
MEVGEWDGFDICFVIITGGTPDYPIPNHRYCTMI